MTPSEYRNLQSSLEARQIELECMLRDREVMAVDSSADMLDQIQHATERDMAIGNLERESDRLLEVRGALRRIHLGTYGICLDCEEEISLKRLVAIPWTSWCLVCREAADRNEIVLQNPIGDQLLEAA